MKVIIKRNVQRWLYITINSSNLDYSIFLLCSYCGIQIHIYFHTILLKKANTKYILIRHLTWMTSKRSVYMKTYLSLRIFFLRLEDFFCLLKNPTFKNIIPCAKHVLNTFKLRTLICTLYLFVVYILFALVILTSIYRRVNNSHDIKVLMKVFKTETCNDGFTSP